MGKTQIAKMYIKSQILINRYKKNKNTGKWSFNDSKLKNT